MSNHYIKVESNSEIKSTVFTNTDPGSGWVEVASVPNLQEGRWYYENGQPVKVPDPPGSSYEWDWSTKQWVSNIATGIQTKTEEITAAASLALSQVTAAYSAHEVATWSAQVSEAQAYQAKASAATPTLSAIAAASNQTVAALASTVLKKAAEQLAASGAIIGKRIALQNQAANAKTQADLDQIKW